MTRLEKLIGFPVPQEHRKELNERLNTYENCDRTTLISLLLQYDWELLQLAKVLQDKISAESFREKQPIGGMIQKSLEALYSASVIAKIKKDINPDFLNAVCKALEKGEIDGFEAVSMIERRHKEIGTCRGCLHYENHCPFIAEQNKRGKLGCYPNKVCGDYKNREEQ